MYSRFFRTFFPLPNMPPNEAENETKLTSLLIENVIRNEYQYT